MGSPEGDVSGWQGGGQLWLAGWDEVQDSLGPQDLNSLSLGTRMLSLGPFQQPADTVEKILPFQELRVFK